jgi:hypothetical protein
MGRAMPLLFITNHYEISFRCTLMSVIYNEDNDDNDKNKDNNMELDNDNIGHSTESDMLAPSMVHQ